MTDDAADLRAQLQAVTGERIAALEAVEPERAKPREAGLEMDRSAGRESDPSLSRESEQTPEPKSVDRGLSL